MSLRTSDENAEMALQRVLTVYISTGLAFLVLPGTFLGVWNLVSITDRHSLAALSPAWLQAHGHAQIFGWIGTFIIGIGYSSLSKMGGLKSSAVRRAWISWAFWTAGVTLRWAANVTEWSWRALLPLSAAFQLAAFLIFVFTVSGHKSRPDSAARLKVEVWMKLVMASTFAFLVALVMNQIETLALAWTAAHPVIPHGIDQRYLFLAAWGFPVLAVWGFNAKWLPDFLGLRESSGAGLLGALAASICGIASALSGHLLLATVLLLLASIAATLALGIFEPRRKPGTLPGITIAFPHFVRGAYVWLLISAALGVCAALWDSYGGIWGASRHSLTVGFLSTMVFAIGQRILPAFCGMRPLYSKKLMFASLAILNIGCLMRVASEVPAYEHNVSIAWNILPVSAVTELTAVILFALNLCITFLVPAPHTGSSKATSDTNSKEAPCLS